METWSAHLPLGCNSTTFAPGLTSIGPYSQPPHLWSLRIKTGLLWRGGVFGSHAAVLSNQSGWLQRSQG
eukprot:9720060-Prorocentrum_lima.AAC.1